MRNDPAPLPIGPAFAPDRPDMPGAMRLKLDLRIHRQRLALRENWMIVDQRLWARTVRPHHRHLDAALRLLREKNDLKERLAEAEKTIEALRAGGHDVKCALPEGSDPMA